MYRKVSLSSFHNGKEYCTTSGFGDIEENASAVFFTQTLFVDITLKFCLGEPVGTSKAYF